MLDFIAIGLGPFNLSLASLLHQKTALNYVFFEQKAAFDWHAGMQLPNTILQVPFMADLVSMIDPTSPFSFLNYLKHQQRLYKFYFMEQSHIPRREYNHYCQWVAQQLQHIHYNTKVCRIEAIEHGFAVEVEQAGQVQHYQCRQLVIGTGNVPQLPSCLQQIQKDMPQQCLHSAQYMQQPLNLTGNVVVLGSGQSAAEVFLDLFDRQYEQDQNTIAAFKLHWLTRADGFFPMENTPLGLEHFSPDYTQYFYQLSESQKLAQLQQQPLLYKGISAKTIDDIYQRLYHRSIAQASQQTHLHSQSNLIAASALDGRIRLHFQHTCSAAQYYLDADTVVAATGYRNPVLDFMQPLQANIATDSQGRWQISQHYRLNYSAAGAIYVQNQEMHSHGVGAPDLGLGAQRAATIINQLLGHPLYVLPDTGQCFQHFNASDNPEMHLVAAPSHPFLRQPCHVKSNLNITPHQPQKMSKTQLNTQKLENIS